jgi:hypothetical protein
MSRELLQQALDALVVWEGVQPITTACAVRIPAIKAIRAHLAQPEQEPVAWQDIHNLSVILTHDDCDPFWRSLMRPLYTAPPQPLTDECKIELWREAVLNRNQTVSVNWQDIANSYAKAIEAAYNIK